MLQPAREAVAAKTMAISKRRHLQHLHSIFLRMKSNGIDYRLLVDATDHEHPNAYNSRLPKPPKPASMVRVVVFLVVAMGFSFVGVDDIQTAFHQLGPLAEPLQRALGVAVPYPGGRSAPALYARYVVVPQGGTWSAVLCHGCALVFAHHTEWFPARKPLRLPGDRNELQSVAPANWDEATIRNARFVHVDDVVSFGVSSCELDLRRQAFRRSSTAQWGVKWKPYEPSAHRGTALGIWMDLESKVWTLKREWISRVAELLSDASTANDDEHTRDWLCGIAAWASSVLLTPTTLLHIVGRGQMERARESLTRFIKAAARFGCPELTTLASLRARRLTHTDTVNSDAMVVGWSAATSLGVSEASKWYSCSRTATFTIKKCCGSADPVTIEPADMQYAEAMASAYIALRHLSSIDRPRSGITLVLCDNEAWVQALWRARTKRYHVMALLVLIHYAMRPGQQLIAAHIDGTVNPADGPSREQRPFVLPETLPTHGAAKRCPLGWTAVCGAVARAEIEGMRNDALPCAFDEFALATQRAMDDKPHNVGCRCEVPATGGGAVGDPAVGL